MAEKRTKEDLLRDLQRSFAIDDYLELKGRFPNFDTALWMVLANDDSSPSWGMDFAFQLEGDYERFGISIKSFLGTLDGDPDVIDKFACEILNALSDREKALTANPHAVSAGKAISNALVDFSIGALVEAFAYYGYPPTNSFQILVKYRLGLFKSVLKEERVLDWRRTMIAKFVAENPTLSHRQIAKSVGVNVSTISRWMGEEKFQSYVRMFQAPPLKLKGK